LPLAERREFLSELVPKLTAPLRLTPSGIRHVGLVTPHPPVGERAGHESTVDARSNGNAAAMAGCASPALRLARILRRLRYDTRHLPALERPSDDDGLRMLALAVLAKKHHFRPAAPASKRSVLIEDPASTPS
jgi:hypothetical protein